MSPMPSRHLEAALTQIERQFDVVSAALVSAEPVALEQASAGLRDMVVQFAQLVKNHTTLHGATSADLALRIRTMSQGLSAQRTSLIRRNASVEGALNSLMPTTRTTTYAPQAGRYGGNARQTGAFKVLAA